MRLILVRHGRTAWNAEGRFTTRTDVPLDNTGLAQAANAGTALAPVRVARILSSPLGRALRTSEAIAAARGPQAPSIKVDARLTEIDAGPFEGRTVAEIEAGPDAAAFRSWHADTPAAAPPGTEPLEAAAARAREFLADVTALPGTTVAVTHGSFARVLVVSAILAADPATHRRLWLDHCHCVVIDTGAERPQLTAFNVERPEAE
jgi:probable phosphoglycerate mutase